MLKRKIDRELRAWKENRGDECLLINGARQVGKTFSIREFGRECYQNFIEVNDLQDKPEGLDVSVLSTDSVSGLPVAPHPYG